MRRRRLLWQILPTCLFLAFAALTAIGWFSIRSLREFYFNQQVADLESRARLVRELVLDEYRSGRGSEIDAFCKRIGAAGDFRITLVDKRGAVLGDSEANPADMDLHAGRPEIFEAQKRGLGISSRYSHTLGRELLYLAIPFPIEDSNKGVVRLSQPSKAMDAAISATLRPIIAASSVVVLLVSGLSLFIVWRLVVPIDAIRKGVDRFARGEFDRRLDIPQVEELGALAGAMNRMASQLDERIRAVVSQRNEHEALLASMVEGVIAVDLDERLLSMNAAAERLLGLSFSQAKGRSLLEAVRNTELQHLIQRTLKGESALEADLVLRGDRNRYLQAHGSSLRDAQGRNIGAVIVLNDVTRIRRLEGLRSEFVANVSHELKTPITSIKGFVETLLDGHAADPGEVRRFLEIISKHADRLSSIIDDLLSLSRIEQEAERAEIVLEPLAIDSILESAVQLCESKAQPLGIRLVQRCEPGLRASVNSVLLEQALINLIDNAIKYTPEGETVTIEARTDGDEAVIEVIDNGTGIPREHLARLFERFYRVDKARSRRMGGTGLGLSIVKHIVQAHGGRVSVESRLGQGSRFRLHLNAA